MSLYPDPSSYTKPLNLTSGPSGYVYFIDPYHPLSSGAAGYVYYHRHMASIREDRWIDSSEHVHHKDSNPGNNHPRNLQILSHSEHARLSAYERSNIVEQPCETCGKMFWPDHSNEVRPHYTCTKECSDIRRFKFDPSKEELTALVWAMPMTKVGKYFEVSDVAVSKRCKRLGIEKPPPGHWAKKQNRT